MAAHYIKTYLNDHLAGSSLGIELASTLATRLKAPANAVLLELGAEFESERNELKSLMKKLDVPESTLRQAGAWLSEKFLEVKLRLEDKDGSFFRFEGLEALSVGIAGKHLMWVCLSDLATRSERFRGPDYPKLISQALSQRERVETLRTRAACDSFLEI